MHPMTWEQAVLWLRKQPDQQELVRDCYFDDPPIASETFDCVLGRQLPHHSRDMSKLCREIGRVLKKGAVFLATREHVISRKEDLGRFLESHPLHRHYGGENAYLLREYLSSIRAGGMDIVRILNPFESDINLFPDTREGLKRRIARRVRLPWPGLIPNAILSFLGDRTRQHGRLYTFLGRRPHGE